jgi:hypothetical protein
MEESGEDECSLAEVTFELVALRYDEHVWIVGMDVCKQINEALETGEHRY